MYRTWIVFAVVALVGVGLAHATGHVAVTLHANADTYLTEHDGLGGSTSVHGDDETLWLIGRSGRRAYPIVRFDLTDYADCRVEGDSVTLSLELIGSWAGASVTQSVSVHAVLVDWVESTASLANFGGSGFNRSIHAGPPLVTRNVSFAGQAATIDFGLPASVVQEWLDDPAANHGLIVISNTNVTQRDLYFSSREHSEPARLSFDLTTTQTETVSPRATYLSTCMDPQAEQPVSIPLVDICARSGDPILIESLGDFAYAPQATEELGQNVFALFSSSDDFNADPNVLHRVPGAIDAGFEDATGDTFFTTCGDPSTDIPEDFLVRAGQPLKITIPAGATHLFFSPGDEFYGDNVDLDSDYAVRITRLAAADLDASGCVDLSDLAILLADFGCPSSCPGDTDGDGDTDLSDLAEVLANFGQGC